MKNILVTLTFVSLFCSSLLANEETWQNEIASRELLFKKFSGNMIDTCINHFLNDKKRIESFSQGLSEDKFLDRIINSCLSPLENEESVDFSVPVGEQKVEDIKFDDDLYKKEFKDVKEKMIASHDEVIKYSPKYFKVAPGLSCPLVCKSEGLLSAREYNESPSICKNKNGNKNEKTSNAFKLYLETIPKEEKEKYLKVKDVLLITAEPKKEFVSYLLKVNICYDESKALSVINSLRTTRDESRHILSECYCSYRDEKLEQSKEATKYSAQYKKSIFKHCEKNYSQLCEKIKLQLKD
ncbi:hypothetical protein N9O57_00830 [bacterium]|nr:hypothetical protein [bacterium]